MQQPDQDPRCHCRRKENGPGEAQRAQEARGQGGGARPARGSQHEEAGDQININNCHLTSDMKVWNNELEAIAQRWADQCFNPDTGGAHDDNRDKLDETSVRGYTQIL